MAEKTAIQWCHHTMNPWIGCAKVHEGCQHCYAEADMDRRRGRVKWGPQGTRSRTSDAYWREPLKWDREAAKAGERRRVFCASLADVFEDWRGPITHHNGNQIWIDENRRMYRDFKNTDWSRPATMDDLRRDLFALIDRTPNLDWLLLTKRPENVRRMWPEWRDADGSTDVGASQFYRGNVWLGTSISLQKHADAQVPELLKLRDLCPVLFLSMEPLLGPVDLFKTIGEGYAGNEIPLIGCPGCGGTGYFQVDPYTVPCDQCCTSPVAFRGTGNGIHWCVVGGESGPRARPMHPDWARALRDQCKVAGVPFFFKQWGGWRLVCQPTDADEVVRAVLDNPAGRWVGPRGEATHTNWDAVYMTPVGKKAAGRLLDGLEHSEFPNAAR